MNAGSSRKMHMADRVLRSIRRRRSIVILRSDLAHLGSAAQLTRVLAKLVEAQRLVRVGHGLYAKTRRNKFTQRPAPAGTFEQIAAEAFRRLGINIGLGLRAREYNEGLTTQVPMTGVVTTGRRRISRRIQVGKQVVTYERERARPTKEKL